MFILQYRSNLTHQDEARRYPSILAARRGLAQLLQLEGVDEAEVWHQPLPLTFGEPAGFLASYELWNDGTADRWFIIAHAGCPAHLAHIQPN